MSWVHCNKCAAKKTGTNRFFITNCTHLFCHTCIDLTNPFCSVCAAKCRLLEVNKDLPQYVKAIFGNTDGQLDGYRKSVKFQNQQMLLFIQKHKGAVQEYQKKKIHVQKLQEGYNGLSKAKAKEQDLIVKLREAFRKMPGHSNTVSPRTLNESPVSPSVFNVSPSSGGTPNANRTRSSGYGSLSGSSGLSKSTPQSAASHSSLACSAQRPSKHDMYRKMMEAKRQRNEK